MELARVLPVADDLLHARARLERDDAVVEDGRFCGLVGDDRVAVAPPQLDRDAAPCDRADTREIGLRAAYAPGTCAGVPPNSTRANAGRCASPGVMGHTRYRAAMLVTGSNAATPANRIPPRARAAAPPGRPCCRRFRTRGAGRAGATGAPSARGRASARGRRSGPRSPRVERQPAPVPVRRDDGKRPPCRQVAPEAQVVRAADTASVRRDDDRDRRMAARAVPRRQHDVRRAKHTRMRAVGEGQRPRAGLRRRRRVRHGDQCDHERAAGCETTSPTLYPFAGFSRLASTLAPDVRRSRGQAPERARRPQRPRNARRGGDHARDARGPPRAARGRRQLRRRQAVRRAGARARARRRTSRRA